MNTTTQNPTTHRVLSGIRATGRLHLGNYLGAVKGMLELQENPVYETLYMVADAHAVTTPYEIEELRKNRREVIIDYLSAGLDPEKSVIFCQADVSQHFELAFYFSSVTTVAKMQHLPTFKDKVKQYPEHATMALLNYPVLMAADILLYMADSVPVGVDQEPHLEVTREIARRMNQDYGTTFPEPKRFATKGGYVPSLTGEGKMSKSVEGSFINLTDSLDEIRAKIRAVPTASEVGGEMSAGLQALFAFYDLFDAEKGQQFQSQFQDGSLRFVDLKDTLAEIIFASLQPLQEKRREIEANPEYVDRVIAEGAEKAGAIARTTMQEVREKMGLH
jgi:tryptophanyl-tRNA synthetase